MKEIPLTQGKVALVDDDDFEWLNRMGKWCVQIMKYTFYARGYVPHDGKSKHIWLHRLIMGMPVGMEVDHIDGDGLNNQRCNLRICTHQDNQRNRRTQVNSMSGFTGVWWEKRRNKWRAGIYVSGKHKHLGYFSLIENAHAAYEAAAREFFGEFKRGENL